MRHDGRAQAQSRNSGSGKREVESKEVWRRIYLQMMSCEEFERFGLDMDRRDVKPEEAALAAEHAANCPHCDSLLASWREVKADLRLLRETTLLESAPSRVEMRLKQELRTRRETRVPRRTFAVASWALAAAAVLAVAVVWLQKHESISGKKNAGAPVVATQGSGNADNAFLLAADYDSSAFTALPASMPSASSDESMLQVRLQRGALMQFGLPVEPERASEWVDVDFLVGEDGQPIGVRLHQDAQSDARFQ